MQNHLQKRWMFPLAIVGILSLGFWAGLIFSSFEKKNITEQQSEISISKENKKTAETSSQIPQQPASIVSPYIPETITFAGTAIDLNKPSTRERLDKELIVNCYWHSNTLFYLKRANRWFPVIEPILQKEGLHDDFKYLAIIESGLSNVISPSGAAGFWQFMQATAGDYNLEINKFVDERYHVGKATTAACTYLKNAYRHYGDWLLTAASYNMGKGALNSVLEEQKVSHYFDLMLNQETARYVFRILAVKQIFENPELYGFMLKPEDLYQPFQTKTVICDKDIDNLIDFALKNGTNYKVLKELNPWLKGKSLPIKKGTIYEILIPSN